MSTFEGQRNWDSTIMFNIHVGSILAQHWIFKSLLVKEFICGTFQKSFEGEVDKSNSRARLESTKLWLQQRFSGKYSNMWDCREVHVCSGCQRNSLLLILWEHERTDLCASKFVCHKLNLWEWNATKKEIGFWSVFQDQKIVKFKLGYF